VGNYSVNFQSKIIVASYQNERGEELGVDYGDWFGGTQ